MKRLTYRTPYGIEYHDKVYQWDIKSKLADYEDAEEQGLLIKLPCKVGDTLYFKVRGYSSAEGKWVEFIQQQKIAVITIDQEHVIFATASRAFWDDDIGKIAFLIKEEAEKALLHD